MLQNIEFIQSFVEEAKNHIADLETGLLNMDAANVGSEEINTVFRAVHSIKGTAGFFGLERIVGLSHTMENVLGECRSGKLKMYSGLIDTLLSANDCLKSMIDNVMESDNTDISAHQKALNAVLAGETEEKSASLERGKRNVLSMEAGKQISAQDSSNQAIIDGIKHGKRLYRICRKLNADLYEKGVNPADFIKSIKNIGTVLECRIEHEEIEEEKSDALSDITLNCLFLSILEKGFLSFAIDVPENIIEELKADIEKEDMKEELREGASDEEGKGKADLPQENLKTPEGTAAKKNTVPGVEDNIRVHISLLNNLLNLASEMVLGRNQLLRAVDPYRKTIPGIEPILQNIDHITTDLQETIMQTRMQPIANVFNKFPRIIRDLSKKLGKDMDLQLEGVDVELDKSIIESLGDPLTHLVRNAADHGLELPDEREKSGKPRTGVITLKAYHEGGYVNIDVVDDGRGIDIEKVREKAIKSGLIDKSELLTFSEQEVLQLLFKPGFSTAEKVTDISGRGVGMDVVKTNIEKLGGTIEIFTNSGKGTIFRLLLPLTLAIIPSLIVEVENQKFALPQVNLQEIVRIKPGDTSRKIEYVHNSEVLRLRGKLLPIVHLADVLGLPRTYIDPITGERKEERRKTLYDQRRTGNSYSDPGAAGVLDLLSKRQRGNNTIRILVLKIGSRRFGVAVDMIHGGEEILVKPIPRYIKDCKCYSGVTIMGDGKIAMILDPEGIVQKASLRFIEGTEHDREKDKFIYEENMKEKQNLIVFKCSGPEFFGLDLSLVSRVEEIKPENIEKIGNKEYINYRGASLRVVRLENYLPVNTGKNENGRLFVIIPKLVKHPMGILAWKIHDTIQTTMQLDQENIKTKGLLGSFIYNNRIILLLNIYELFELIDPEKYSVEVSKIERGAKRVLLVEDTPFFLKMEQSYLKSAGYDVLTAGNGKEALQLLQENKVDIVVSDIHMPVMDGLELAKRVRNDSRFAHLPMIAVTSMTGEKQMKTGLMAGFDFYEFKLDRASLLEKIEEALKNRGYNA